ncbi:MAG: glycosyltransferase family 1 protein [Bacteroidales bacterium]|nr:glycosyltransferase family 1 protein [Bacteroidales bacterium]MDD4739753.1 glycosyltransferase family 1 protein [Bacteroidales bacterium]
MIIAIEGQRIFRKKKHGMDFVALETIREIQKIDKTNQYYIIVAPGEDKCLEETENFKIVEINSFGGYFGWEQIALAKEIKKIKPDILHCTSNTAPLFGSPKLIITLHDIIFLEKLTSKNKSIYQKLGRIYRRFVVPRIIPKAKKIITVSEFERDRIKDFLKLDSNKIISIYNGYSKHFQIKNNPKEVFRKYINTDNYLFFLGNTDPKKNTDRTILAYADYISRAENGKIYSLLIADLKEEYVDTILERNNIQHIKQYLVCPDYIPNVDLPYIYSGARAFLYTSLRESFGIPILESMACGCPIITSNTSAIPEIAGKGAILINPLNIEEISTMIERLIGDENFRAKQINYGLERVKLFSWANTARELINVYHQVFND